MEQFQLKPTIFFGSDALAALEGLAGRRVMVITDSFLAQSGLLERVRARLRDCTVEVFDQVVPDPPLELVAQGARALAEFRPQAVVAFGGGSPMDCAKAWSSARSWGPGRTSALWRCPPRRVPARRSPPSPC